MTISNTQASEPCVDVIGSNFKRPYGIFARFLHRVPQSPPVLLKHIFKADLIQNEGAVFMAETESDVGESNST